MSDSKVPYPGLYAACLEIALDNGGINRFRPQKQQQREYRRWLATQVEEVVRPIDAWLSTLSEETLILVCSGGEGEAETEQAKAGAPPFLDDVLNSYFEEVC